jgi:predicted nucleic acid-binding protein
LDEGEDWLRDLADIRSTGIMTKFQKQRLYRFCKKLARHYGIEGKDKDDFITHCFISKETDPDQLYADFLGIITPVVEGVPFKNVAVLDTMPLDAIRIAKRFREYASQLDRYGKLYVNTAVLSELQRHGLITPIVEDLWGNIKDVSTQISKIISNKDYPERAKAVVDLAKWEIAKLINSEIARPEITQKNIEIVTTDEEAVRQIRTTLEVLREKLADEASFADLACIDTMMDEGIPVIVAADKHFDDHFKFWKNYVETALEDPNAKFKILSQKTLGEPKK